MLAAAAATLFACLAPGVASAETVTVTTTFDEFGPDPCTPAACTLRGAIELSAPGTVVIVPPGDYVLVGDFQTLVDLTIQGAGPSTRLIAAQAPGNRVLTVVDGTLTVSGVEITDGVAPGAPGHGGGALVDGDAVLRLIDSTVANNEANSGGGIWVEGRLELIRSTVTGNDALGDFLAGEGRGGGIAVDVIGDATLENTTVSGNTAAGGGGIYTANHVLLKNATIAGNTAPLMTTSRGGGILQEFSSVDSETDATNALVVQNTGKNCGGTQFDPIDSDHGMSDEPLVPTCNVGNPALNTLVPDAMIGPLASNGGFTRTRALLAASPAIGAGNPATCLADDQRGVSRGAVCDIGAFEFVPAPPPSPSGPPQPSPQELPPPVAGKSVNAETKSGTVKIKLPGTNTFVVLGEQQLPVGTTVDATKGRVTLVAASDKSGGTVTADFYEGIFRIGQTNGAKPITTLKLVEKLSCGKGKAGAAAKKKKKRHLWGDGKGKFRTDGSYSSATVRGTKWLTQDSCTSTLTKVVRGSVTVRDFVKKKNVIVKAGKKYVANRKP